MSITEEIQGALEMFSTYISLHFGSEEDMNDHIIKRRGEVAQYMYNEGLSYIYVPENELPPSDNLYDNVGDYLHGIYKDFALTYTGYGLKAWSAALAVEASSVTGPTATFGERMALTTLNAADTLAASTAEAVAFTKGLSWLGLSFVALGAATKVIESDNPLDELEQQIFSQAGGLIAADLIARTLPAKIPPLWKAGASVTAGAFAQLVLEDYYESVLDDIIEDAIANSWTAEQLEAAIATSSQAYIDGKWDTLLVNLRRTCGTICWESLMTSATGFLGTVRNSVCGRA